MRFQLPKSLFLVPALVLAPTLALAQPANWSVTGVTFNDGGALSGSFTYDVSTNTFSLVNITTTTGAARTGATYHFVSNGFPPTSGAVLLVTSNAVDQTGNPALALIFTPALAPGGGTSTVAAQESSCGDAICSLPVAPFRFSANGNPIATGVPALSVPILSEWGLLLFSALLVGVAALYFRKSGIPAAKG